MATFPIITSVVPTITATTLSATYNGMSKSVLLTLNPLPSPSLASLVLHPTIVVGGSPSTGTVTLSAVAPAGGATVVLTTSNTSRATVPTSVVIAAGTTSQTFTVSTETTKQLGGVTIAAPWLGVTQTAGLWVKRQ